ncbi:metallophosphoesterase [Flavobacterium sp.]|uniref:metallophosphoesterase n=1 Tax=Flavobacterium sp. TaxID=239 RepID=UPI0038FCEA7F
MSISFKTNEILLWGDLHGLDRAIYILNSTLNIDNQTILMLGDFGLGFSSRENDDARLKKINILCIQRNILLYVISGNHDNKDFWRRGYEFSNLFLIKDYTPAIFPNKKTALLVGGGISIDRSSRREGLDYWSDEITIYVKQNEHYDYLFAHDCPNYFNNSTESLWSSPYQDFLRDDPDLFEDALDQRNVIGQIVEDIKCEWCFSGHFHNNVKEEKNGIKYQCLNIEELFIFDSNIF